MDFLGDPWTVLVLRELMYGVHRFEELKKNTEATDKTLADRLEKMVRDGLVRREQYSGTARPRYEYHLTPSGKAAKPVLEALADWGGAHTAGPELEQRFQLRCGGCAEEVKAAAGTCPHCGASLSEVGTSWLRPSTACSGRHASLAPAVPSDPNDQ
ncbi:MAG TPA: helix-turn-helix domain-containing protein [Flexivirga sp.]|uniref:winged helix-turn-helix transcriptional regulator n=1 Tax=Flexivirga sp. TaxID=1962927 RepID=UPI002C8C4E80|nr:helix-turn-helix domain-containing protein [Flexivirga sp.]HWC21810.1 helix-turn-helix domain-containing protein [Flexivirga sp.]